MEILTREAAAERGIKRYYTALPCINGHVAERYTSSNGCVACLKRFSPRRNGEGGKVHRYWPERGLIISARGAEGTTIQEGYAAFRYMENAGWLAEAVIRLRADPKLMARFAEAPTTKALLEAENKLEALQRARKLAGEGYGDT